MNGDKEAKNLGGIFVIVGSGILLISLYLLFVNKYDDTAISVAIVSGIIGIVSVGIGFGVIAYVVRKQKNRDLLISSGLCLSAELVEIVKRADFKKNGQCAYRIICFCKNSTGLDHVFESLNIWMNPEPLLPDGNRLKVYVLPDDYEKYYVDLSFIPEEYR